MECGSMYRHGLGGGAMEPGAEWKADMLPEGTVWPDYGQDGIFALSRIFARHLDGAPWSLPGGLDSSGGVLVFLLIDGLGDLFLQTHGAGSQLAAQRRGRLTSVFPSTTSSAVTTLMTGLSPAQHGLTGWHVFDSRFGGVLAPLPLTRLDNAPVKARALTRRLFPYDTLYQRARRPSVVVSPEKIAHSPFSVRHSRGARIRPYPDRDESALVSEVCAAVRELTAAGGGLVHAYYPDFDGICHAHGCTSPHALSAFARADHMFAQLCAQLAGSGAQVVASADHGFIDSPPDRRLRIDEQPGVHRFLLHPLFGERRAAFCHVAPQHWPAFEQAAQDWLGERGRVVRSAGLLAQGVFGPPPHHRRIAERIGTHALLMAPGWTVIDCPPDKTPHDMLGVHGGLSASEMWVPLIACRL